MSLLILKGLEKTYPDGTRAVRGIKLAVERGEFIVLLGPSGCGKTTTLRMVAGLEIPTGGSISLGGKDVTKLRPALRDVGMVFQFYALYPQLSVRENIAFPLRAVGGSKLESHAKANAMASQLGIESLLDRFPGQLSGGDQQRVSLARVLVRKPQLQLMDEPLGTLDADARQALREFIRQRQLTDAMTTLYVTHDQEEAMCLADRVVVMSEGEIRQVGTPKKLYDRPDNLFVARFVGSPGMNFATGLLEKHEGKMQFCIAGSELRVPVDSGVQGVESVLGIRAEYLQVSEDGPLPGRIVWVEYLGAHQSLHVEGVYGRWVVRAPLSLKCKVGDNVRLSAVKEQLHLFDEETGQRQ